MITDIVLQIDCIIIWFEVDNFRKFVVYSSYLATFIIIITYVEKELINNYSNKLPDDQSYNHEIMVKSKTCLGRVE